MSPASKSPIIGTLMETSLHAALKEWYAQPGDRTEVPMDGYVIDLVRDELLIEIQTSNFAAIRDKLFDLVERHTLRLVYPIAREKWIVRMSADGEILLGRRKSPKRGRLEHLFDELVRFPQLVARPSFSLEVLLTQEEEVRWNDGLGSWRRKGWSIHDRRLLDVVDQISLSFPSDFLALLPLDLAVPFTNRELARALDLSHRVAQRMTYCMRKMDVLCVKGKRRNALLHVPA